MDDFVVRKNEKLKMLRDEKAHKEVEGCVFKPTIYTRRCGKEAPQPRKFD